MEEGERGGLGFGGHLLGTVAQQGAVKKLAGGGQGAHQLLQVLVVPLVPSKVLMTLLFQVL